MSNSVSSVSFSVSFVRIPKVIRKFFRKFLSRLFLDYIIHLFYKLIFQY